MRSALLHGLVAVSLTVSVAFGQGSGWPSIFGSQCGTGGANPATCVLGNGDAELVLTNGAQGYYVSSVGSAATGPIDFAESKLFEIELEEQGVVTSFSPSDFTEMHYVSSWLGTFIVWRHQNALPGWLSVVARVRYTDGGFRFDVWVQNDTPAALRQVCYPIIAPKQINPDFQTTLASDLLIVPFQGGAAYPDPWNLPSLQFPNPGTSMQLFCLYDRINKRSLYWQTRDSLGYRKDYRVTGQGTSTRFDVVHFPINNTTAGNDYLSPFSFELLAQEGTWYEAAMRYREWAHFQPWMARGLIEDSEDFSAKIKDVQLTTLMYPNHLSAFEDFNALASDGERLKTWLGLSAGGLMMLWSDWHTKVFNVELPDLLPARDGVEDGVVAAQEAGLLVVPYCHVNAWSPDSTRYMELNVAGSRWTLPDGTNPSFLAGPNASLLLFPHFTLNPAFSTARNASREIVLDVLSALTTTQWDGIYLDTWTNRTPELDYNPGLYLTGGTPFWSLGKRLEGTLLSHTIKCQNPDAFVTSEFPQENVMDKVELTYYDPFGLGTIQFPVWETVYHGYALTCSIGNTVPQPSPALVPFYLANLSYDFHLGKIMGLTNFFADTIPFVAPIPATTQSPEMLDYLAALLAVDRDARKYRVLGERLRPLNTSIAASLENLTYFLVGPPNVATSIWRASDGDVGVVITNRNTATEVVVLDVDFSLYNLSGTYDVFVNLGGIRIPLIQVSSSFTLPLPIPARSAQLIEIVPAASN